jgi:phage-related protein
MESIRSLIFFKRYFFDFYDDQPEKVKEKIDYVLYLIRHIEQIPQKFLKHVEGTKGLHEVRVEYGGNIYRIFCCFDEGRIVILLNGYQKKSQKALKGEIEKALLIMREYFTDKQEKS